MYREFLITSKNQETTFFTDDIETTLDVLRKKYPNSEITLCSGGTKMSTKKSSKDIAKNANVKPEKQPKKTSRRGFDEKTEKDIIKDYENKISYVNLAEKYQSSRGSIYNVLVRNKIIIPQKRKTKNEA